MKKYSKIIRHGKRGTHLTLEGRPHIVVMEKLDGSNSSFGIVDGELKCFSRNQKLTEDNNLRGFYQWVHSNIDKDNLEKDIIYFGEWLVPHTIKYPQEAYNNFYLFDIYNKDTERYIDISLVKEQANKLNLSLAPIFYEGKFQSLDHINSFVGKSKVGDVGEGVVVKNYSYEDKYGVQQFTKIVSDAFTEKAKTKKRKLSQHANELDEFVNTYLTTARVEKMLYKLVDEGVLKENFGIEDMGIILKNSGGKIVEDIIEEEIDSLVSIVKKKIGKKYPSVIKEVILK